MRAEAMVGPAGSEHPHQVLLRLQAGLVFPGEPPTKFKPLPAPEAESWPRPWSSSDRPASSRHMQPYAAATDLARAPEAPGNPCLYRAGQPREPLHLPTFSSASLSHCCFLQSSPSELTLLSCC